MKKRTLLIVLLAFALVIPGCGQKRQSQSKLTVASTKATSNNSAQDSQANQNAQKTYEYTKLHESLQSRLTALGLPTPTRPSPSKLPDVKPVHLEAKKNISNSKLPRVEITLPDNYLLSNDSYTKATISISNAGNNNIPASNGKVRIRGNSTAELAKKPLKIRFESKQGLFGREHEKTWTLLANCFDATGIHNYVAYNLYDKITPEGTFSSLCVFVDVYVNGEYQGVYNLCDQIETGKGRVPVSGKVGQSPETTEYLIELDSRASAESPNGEGLDWFWLTWSNDSFNVKSPETKDGLSEAHTAFIKNYMDDVFAAVSLKDWEALNALIDVNSFITVHAIVELTKNVDVHHSNVYLYKKSDGKLTFGPIWNFDTSFGTGEGTAGSTDGFVTETGFFAGFMQIPEYKETFKTYFNDHLNEMISIINKSIDTVDAEYGESLEKEYQNWGKEYSVYSLKEMQGLPSHAEQTAFMKKWLNERAAWLHTEYNK